MDKQFIDVNLSIQAEEYLRLYQGTAEFVVARALDGRTVKFPAKILQRFVTKEGIRGRYVIVFSKEGKFLDIAQRSQLPQT